MAPMIAIEIAAVHVALVIMHAEAAILVMF